jgi:hypothetical protein
LAAMVILGTLGLSAAAFVRRFSRNLTRMNVTVQSQGELRGPFIQGLERDILDIKQITDAQSGQIKFIMDSHRMKSYAPEQVTEPGYTRRTDPDDDNDELVIPNLENQQWKYGNDLDDDDDNNNNLLDVQCRYIYNAASRTLARYISEDQAPWSLSGTLKNVTTFQLTYFGSPNEVYGQGFDANDNGLIEATEMPGAPPAAATFSIAAAATAKLQKRNYITSIRLRLGHDANGDGKQDMLRDVELAPPLLPNKRKLRW